MKISKRTIDPFIWVLKVEILNKSNENHQETSKEPPVPPPKGLQG